MKNTKSNKYLAEALQYIPTGSQTFSKSHLQYPKDISPLAIEKAKGSYCVDIDGNIYLDVVNSLAAISLGHCDEDIINAVTTQLAKGTIFSLASDAELKLAKLINEIIPCAEMVKFGKNASDATSAAIRLSRHVTGKNKVAVCGYHGWQDWYISTTTRNAGIPKEVASLTSSFTYNNIESLAELINDGDYAAIILEPMNIAWPQNDFLHKVQAIAQQHNCLLIFDETVTGVRYGLGGAQQLFDITPDLCVLGKGIANGYPISVIAGKRKYMEHFEEVFYSTTFGGETLSIVAAIATIEKFKSSSLLVSLYTQGSKLIQELSELINEYKLDNVEIVGHPTWSFIDLSKYTHLDQMILKTLFIQTMLENNVICLGSNILNATFQDKERALLINAYLQFFKKLVTIENDDDILALLKSPPLKPIMSIR